MTCTRFLALLAATVFCLISTAETRAAEVTVFAAASLTNAIDEIGSDFAAKGLGKVIASYAASSTLAKQIDNGAPANIFISADVDWMNYLADRKLVDAGSREDLLGNTLVLIAPAGAPSQPVNLLHGPHLAVLLGEGRLATGDPDHVPAGKYAKEALEALGQWKELEPKLARAASVRDALSMVERAETPLGIVYGTDAAVAVKVKVVATFPDNLHAPIVYPAALVAGQQTPAAAAFLAFLKTKEARQVFRKYGFTPR